MPADLAIVLELIAFAVLLGLSGFFSSSETALFSLNRLQLEQMRRDGDKSVTLIERLLSQPRHLIVTILIGNEFVNVAASVISAALVIQFFGADSKWLNLLIMVPMLLLFGEITPKTLAIRNNVAFARTQSRWINLFARAITPLRWLVRHIAGYFITLIVGEERSRANILTEDMVRSLAREAVGEGVLDSEEALYINRIFDFGEMTLREVMTPRSQIFFLRADKSLETAAAAYHRNGHTKIPVYDRTKDAIIGILYARDLLRLAPTGQNSDGPSSTISEIVREAYFVPESKSLADLFYTFRKRKLSLALTVDEFGGVTGLVTMEDLLECIFGDIVSRSELLRQRRVNIEKIGDRIYRIDGSMTIAQFNRLLGGVLASETAETVGGLLLEACGELPETDRRVVIGGYEFTVNAVAHQRIADVTVKLLDDTAQSLADSKREAKPVEAPAAAIGSPETAGKAATSDDASKD